MSSVPNTSFLSIAVSIFFVLNATGQIPLFLAMLSRYDQKRQMRIIVRELLIALVLLLLFTFFGDWILKVLGITRPIIGIAGGILLFLISLTMIFPTKASKDELQQQEPLIIPLAIPIITGPGAIATVMLYAHETANSWLVAGAAVAAWIPSLMILLLGSTIKNVIGEKGLVAIERLGGMLVCLIGLQMLTSSTLMIVKDFYHIDLPIQSQQSVLGHAEAYNLYPFRLKDPEISILPPIVWISKLTTKQLNLNKLSDVARFKIPHTSTAKTDSRNCFGIPKLDFYRI